MKYALLVCTILVSSGANGAELTHNFNSPAFSGIGYSSHVLTIKQLEDQAKEKNQAKAEALKAQAERDAANTPTARFIANLESRIYSQLAKQLTDSMFGEGATCTTAGVVCGSIPDIGGNKIEWSLGGGSDSGMIIINIQNLSNPTQITTMKVPAGTFYF
jgi:ABC-type oligopeptide transport system substrate-binding subunit